jgi:hypothetical protein
LLDWKREDPETFDKVGFRDVKREILSGERLVHDRDIAKSTTCYGRASG